MLVDVVLVEVGGIGCVCCDGMADFDEKWYLLLGYGMMGGWE